MRGIKKFRILRQSLRIAGADKVLFAYILFYILVSVLMWRIEPNIATFADSLWYCFAVATTIGFGDIAAVSGAGRVLTVVLSVYSIAVIAILTAVITSYYMDVAKARAEDSAKEFMDELERLPKMSKEELKALSRRVKHFRSND